MPTTVTSGPLIALFDNLADGVTPTANFSPPSGYPLSSLSTPDLWTRTRTPDLTADRQLSWDLGASVESNVFLLAGTNATAAATGRWEAADNSGFSSGLVQSWSGLQPVFDTSLGHSRAAYVPPWGRLIAYVHPVSVLKRYYRWHQSDSANPDGYQSWGVAGIGLAWQPGVGFESWRAMPTYTGSTGSQIARRGHELTFPLLTKAEAYDLQSIALTALGSRRVLVIPEALERPTYLHDALWAVMEGAYVREPVSGTMFAEKRYRVVLTFREVSR